MFLAVNFLQKQQKQRRGGALLAITSRRYAD